MSGGAGGGGDDDEDFAALRRSVRAALMKRNSETLSAVTYSASEGDVDAVRALLKRGLPIDSGDYDGRTTLHLACAEGNLKARCPAPPCAAMRCLTDARYYSCVAIGRV